MLCTSWHVLHTYKIKTRSTFFIIFSEFFFLLQSKSMTFMFVLPANTFHQPESHLLRTTYRLVIKVKCLLFNSDPYRLSSCTYLQGLAEGLRFERPTASN